MGGSFLELTLVESCFIVLVKLNLSKCTCS